VDGDTAVKIVKARSVTGDRRRPGPDQRSSGSWAPLLRSAVQNQVLLDRPSPTACWGAVSKNASGDNIGVDQLPRWPSRCRASARTRLVFTSVPVGGAPSHEVLVHAVINGTPLPSEGAAGSGPLVDPSR